MRSYASQNNLYDAYQQGESGNSKEALDQLEQLTAQTIRSPPSGFIGNTSARRLSRRLLSHRVGTDFGSSETVSRKPSEEVPIRHPNREEIIEKEVDSRQVSFDFPTEDSPKNFSREVSPGSPDLFPKNNL